MVDSDGAEDVYSDYAVLSVAGRAEISVGG